MSYGIAIVVIAFLGACPLFLPSVLGFNFSGNSLMQFSSQHLETVACASRNTLNTSS